MLLTYVGALEAAIAAEMRLDPKVFHMGTIAPGPLLAEFGDARVRRSPISESAMSGMAVGAAASGWRPVVNLRATTFTFVAFDQLVNQAAKIRYMLGGQADFPIVYRTFYIGGQRSAAQHSQSAYAMLAHVPGLKITAPSNPADAYGLLRAAIRDDNPVVHFEANRLDTMMGDVPEDLVVELGSAATCRAGVDVTIVAIGSMVGPALDAAETIARSEGASVEVIDPRTLVPLDVAAIRSSVQRTGRLVVADESPPACSMAAEIATVVVEDVATFRALQAPVARVCSAAVPVPFSPPLEDFVLPDADNVASAVRQVLAHG
ncbi:MAG: alpha-ketoacid dehydrogenase subunit beta [Ilumatobacteraceae bacterium]